MAKFGLAVQTMFAELTQRCLDAAFDVAALQPEVRSRFEQEMAKLLAEPRRGRNVTAGQSWSISEALSLISPPP